MPILVLGVSEIVGQRREQNHEQQKFCTANFSAKGEKQAPKCETGGSNEQNVLSQSQRSSEAPFRGCIDIHIQPGGARPPPNIEHATQHLFCEVARVVSNVSECLLLFHFNVRELAHGAKLSRFHIIVTDMHQKSVLTCLHGMVSQVEFECKVIADRNEPMECNIVARHP